MSSFSLERAGCLSSTFKTLSKSLNEDVTLALWIRLDKYFRISFNDSKLKSQSCNFTGRSL